VCVCLLCVCVCVCVCATNLRLVTRSFRNTVFDLLLEKWEKFLGLVVPRYRNILEFTLLNIILSWPESMVFSKGRRSPSNIDQ
jgi:hypothetical protein